jgi:hypothetical protein
MDVLKAFAPYVPKPAQLTSTELFEAHEALKADHAKALARIAALEDAYTINKRLTWALKNRIADLEDACKVARMALRKVMQLAGRMPGDVRELTQGSVRVVGVDYGLGVLTTARDDGTFFTRAAVGGAPADRGFDANGSEVT